jgi:crotonobetainyl-CoA:carnitine CoA-transferase CaiB-like acyl-CoA transferase
MIVPYGAYACSDGAVIFAIQNQREWRSLCAEVLDMPALADDPRFASNEDRLRNREELERLIEERLRLRTQAEALVRLDEAGIPTGAVNDVPAVARHPQLAARHRWVEVDSPGGVIPALLPPHNLEHVPPCMGAVPALGQHTQEILEELRMG